MMAVSMKGFGCLPGGFTDDFRIFLPKRWCNIQFGAIFDVWRRYSIHNVCATVYATRAKGKIFCAGRGPAKGESINVLSD